MAFGLENAGMIVYDIPDELVGFGAHLRKRLRRAGALPVNLSVYLVNWADVPRLNEIVRAAKARYAVQIDEAVQNLHNRRPLRVNILRFDNRTAAEALDMAREGLAFLVGDIHRALDRRIAKMADQAEAELPRRVQVDFVRRLQDAESMAVAFRLMEDIEVALDALRGAVAARLGAEVAAKYLKSASAATPMTTAGAVA